MKNMVEIITALNFDVFFDANAREVTSLFLLQNMGIKDEFHQKNILVCIEELCQPSPPPPVATETTGSTTPGVAVDSGCSLGVSYPGNNATNNAHNLVPHSFSVLEKCDKCHKYLRGLLHQGFLCQGTFASLILNFLFRLISALSLR